MIKVINILSILTDRVYRLRAVTIGLMSVFLFNILSTTKSVNCQVCQLLGLSTVKSVNCQVCQLSSMSTVKSVKLSSLLTVKSVATFLVDSRSLLVSIGNIPKPAVNQTLCHIALDCHSPLSSPTVKTSSPMTSQVI